MMCDAGRNSRLATSRARFMSTSSSRFRGTRAYCSSQSSASARRRRLPRVIALEISAFSSFRKPPSVIPIRPARTRAVMPRAVRMVLVQPSRGRQDPAAARKGQAVGARDSAHDGTVAQHGIEVAARAGERGAEGFRCAISLSRLVSRRPRWGNHHHPCGRYRPQPRFRHAETERSWPCLFARPERSCNSVSARKGAMNEDKQASVAAQIAALATTPGRTLATVGPPLHEPAAEPKPRVRRVPHRLQAAGGGLRRPGSFHAPTAGGHRGEAFQDQAGRQGARVQLRAGHDPAA
jgi:hypothetical protein